MPEGQFLGERKVYVYTADDDEQYLIRTDGTLGDIAGTGLVAATSGTTAGTLPSGIKPRVVFWQGELNDKIVRKQLVCNRNGTLLTANKSTALEIDGVQGATTGRRGEKQTFLRLPTGGDGAGDGGGGGLAAP